MYRWYNTGKKPLLFRESKICHFFLVETVTIYKVTLHYCMLASENLLQVELRESRIDAHVIVIVHTGIIMACFKYTDHYGK